MFQIRTSASFRGAPERFVEGILGGKLDALRHDLPELTELDNLFAPEVCALLTHRQACSSLPSGNPTQRLLPDKHRFAPFLGAKRSKGVSVSRHATCRAPTRPEAVSPAEAPR